MCGPHNGMLLVTLKNSCCQPQKLIYETCCPRARRNLVTFVGSIYARSVELDIKNIYKYKQIKITKTT